MAIQTTDKIWHNGVLIPWNDAQIHVMSHVSTTVPRFLGASAATHPLVLPAIFRLRDHMQRLSEFGQDLPH